MSQLRYETAPRRDEETYVISSHVIYEETKKNTIFLECDIRKTFTGQSGLRPFQIGFFFAWMLAALPAFHPSRHG